MSEGTPSRLLHPQFQPFSQAGTGACCQPTLPAARFVSTPRPTQPSKGSTAGAGFQIAAHDRIVVLIAQNRSLPQGRLRLPPEPVCLQRGRPGAAGSPVLGVAVLQFREKSVVLLARPEGFEPPTHRSVVRLAGVHGCPSGRRFSGFSRFSSHQRGKRGVKLRKVDDFLVARKTERPRRGVVEPTRPPDRSPESRFALPRWWSTGDSNSRCAFKSTMFRVQVRYPLVSIFAPDLDFLLEAGLVQPE
jgi:hypothetical protein